MNWSQSDLSEGSKAARFWNKHLDKILLGIGCSYLFFVILWLVFGKPPTQPIAQKPILSAQDAQFIAYLQQSLNVLDRQTAASQAKVPQENPAPPAAPTVIERIYVPIYPPNQAPTSSVATLPPSPPSRATRIPQPPPLPVTKLPTTVPILTPKQPLPPIPAQTAAMSPPTTNLGYMLVGVLEAGDRSSALFSFNGEARRFELGEVVGNSGWTLLAVQDQKAVLSRNGNTRYLEVGQGF